jgi:hypothetical protein
MSIQIKSSNEVINFYEELYKSLDNDVNDNDNECLITLMPLQENAVTLKCGHKFNYEALYDEIYNQKYVLQKYNILDQKYRKFLQKNLYFLKCPYCRELQTELLPYLPEVRPNLCYGINTDDLKYEKFTVPGYTHVLQDCHPIHTVKQPVTNGTCEYPGCDSNKNIYYNQVTHKKCCLHHYNTSLNELKKKCIQDKKLADKEAKLAAIKKCGYTMKTGNKCTCKAVKDSDFCGKHTKTFATATAPTCVALTKKGTPCGCKAVDKVALLCNRHKPKMATTTTTTTVAENT